MSSGDLPRVPTRFTLVNIGWGIADQALSSVTNFGLAIVAARTLRTADFGALSIAFTGYAFGLGVSRAVASEPLIIRFSGARDEDWRRATGWSAGASILIGLGGGVMSLLACLLVGGQLSQVLLVLGLTLPWLLVQDHWRFAFFAQGEGRLSLANDLVWASIAWPALLLLVMVLHRATGSWLLLAWAGAGSVAAGVGAFQARVAPNMSAARRWWGEQRDLIPRILGEFIAVSGASQLTIFGIGSIAGLATVGALRGAEVLMGPVNILILGVAMVAIPESVASLKHSPSSLRRTSMLFSIGLGTGSALWGAIVMVLPTSVGMFALGDTWRVARSAVPGLILWQTALGVSAGAVTGLRALQAVKASLRVRVVVAPLIVSGGVVGAFVGGAGGAALGLGFANCLGAALWWIQFGRALRGFEQAGAGSDLGAVDP